MDDMRRKVFNLTIRLQNQKELPLWALANQQVIYSIATGKKEMAWDSLWGPKTKMLRSIIKVAYKIKAADFIIFFTGLFTAGTAWWKIRKSTFRMRKLGKPKRVFAGFGASAEEYLYADYTNQSLDLPLRINWINHEGEDRLGCPSLLLIFRLLIHNSFGYTAKLKGAIDEIAANAIDFLTVCSVNIGSYAFYCSYWSMAKQRGVEEVAFLAPSVTAFACVNAKLRTVFIQHGLMASGILMPEFNCAYVLTDDEARYFTLLYHRINIVKFPQKINMKNGRSDVILILGMSVFQCQKEHLSDLIPFLSWTKKIGLKLIFRPGPRVTQCELRIIQDYLPDVMLDDFTISLEESLEQWKPQIVVSWISTGLATALGCGFLPVSLCDPLADNDTWNMIYAMQKRVLFYPKDEHIIREAIQLESAYHDQLSNLRHYQDRCFDSNI